MGKHIAFNTAEGKTGFGEVRAFTNATDVVIVEFKTKGKLDAARVNIKDVIKVYEKNQNNIHRGHAK